MNLTVKPKARWAPDPFVGGRLADRERRYRRGVAIAVLATITLSTVLVAAGATVVALAGFAVGAALGLAALLGPPAPGHRWYWQPGTRMVVSALPLPRPLAVASSVPAVHVARAQRRLGRVSGWQNTDADDLLAFRMHGTDGDVVMDPHRLVVATERRSVELAPDGQYDHLLVVDLADGSSYHLHSRSRRRRNDRPQGQIRAADGRFVGTLLPNGELSQVGMADGSQLWSTSSMHIGARPRVHQHWWVGDQHVAWSVVTKEPLLPRQAAVCWAVRFRPQVPADVRGCLTLLLVARQRIDWAGD